MIDCIIFCGTFELFEYVLRDYSRYEIVSTIKKRKISNCVPKYFIFEAECLSWLRIKVAAQLMTD